jgi:hypothetical protein
MHGRYLALRTARAISWEVHRGVACAAVAEKGQSLKAAPLASAMLREQVGLQPGEDLEECSVVSVVERQTQASPQQEGDHADDVSARPASARGDAVSMAGNSECSSESGKDAAENRDWLLAVDDRQVFLGWGDGFNLNI